MAEMTLEQKRAVAMANARMRMAEQGGAQAPEKVASLSGVAEQPGMWDRIKAGAGQSVKNIDAMGRNLADALTLGQSDEIIAENRHVQYRPLPRFNWRAGCFCR
jgi:hypothetical protein